MTTVEGAAKRYLTQQAPNAAQRRDILSSFERGIITVADLICDEAAYDSSPIQLRRAAGGLLLSTQLIRCKRLHFHPATVAT